MSHATAFEREIREQPEILKRLLQDDAAVRIGAELRSDPPAAIATLARGSSDNAVTFFAYLAGLHLGTLVASIPPSLVTIQRASLKVRGSLAVAVSQSGESPDVVAACKSLAAAGARTLAVTNGVDSALHRSADATVLQGAGVERAVAASKTFSTQMAALSRVVAEWANDDELRRSLAQVPDAIAAVLSNDDAVRVVAERLASADQVDVLGRGLSYGPAFEAALKIKETAYLHAHAYSAAEFQHGPIATLSAGDPVLLFGSADATNEPNREAAQRVRGASADLIVVASDPRLLALADLSVPLPGGLSPVTEAFVQVVVGQVLALRLAERLGLNPDAPRHLNKVTRTR